MSFKPLLAFRENPILKALHYPKLLSPKFDGIRAVRISSEQLRTRKLKLVPNELVRDLFEVGGLHNVDGELIVGDPRDPTVYHKTESVVMSYAPPKRPDGVKLYLFDSFERPDDPYETRYGRLLRLRTDSRVVIVEQRLARSAEEVLEYENECVEAGYEGIMLRSPRGHYKFGRSTLSEEILLKLKRFADSEAYITGFEEQNANQNEAKLNELGYMKRSKRQEGMVGKGTLGTIIGYDPRLKWEVRVGMGPGLTDAERARLWSIREKLLKQKAWFKYRYQPAGTKDKPRSPRYMGLRSKKDM